MAVGRGDDAIAVFARDASMGALDFLEFHDDPMPGVNVLGGIEDVAVSPDGTADKNEPAQFKAKSD